MTTPRKHDAPDGRPRQAEPPRQDQRATGIPRDSNLDGGAEPIQGGRNSSRSSAETRRNERD